MESLLKFCFWDNHLVGPMLLILRDLGSNPGLGKKVFITSLL